MRIRRQTRVVISGAVTRGVDGHNLKCITLVLRPQQVCKRAAYMAVSDEGDSQEFILARNLKTAPYGRGSEVLLGCLCSGGLKFQLFDQRV